MVTDCAMDIVKTDKPSISVALPRSAADWSLAEQETARSKRQQHLDRVKDYFATQLNLPQHVLTHIEITGQLDKRGNVKWSYAWAPECAADGFRCSNRAEFAKRVQREWRQSTCWVCALCMRPTAARACLQGFPVPTMRPGHGNREATLPVLLQPPNRSQLHEQKKGRGHQQQQWWWNNRRMPAPAGNMYALIRQQQQQFGRTHPTLTPYLVLQATCDMKALRRIRQLEAALQSQVSSIHMSHCTAERHDLTICSPNRLRRSRSRRNRSSKCW